MSRERGPRPLTLTAQPAFCMSSTQPPNLSAPLTPSPHQLRNETQDEKGSQGAAEPESTLSLEFQPVAHIARRARRGLEMHVGRTGQAWGGDRIGGRGLWMAMGLPGAA